jgi:imidazoleglycerol phosphate dehydratase HisB
MSARTSHIQRRTKETDIILDLVLDGNRQIEIATGLGFFDHMLNALAFHAGWNLNLKCSGDLEVDDHHTIEDCGIALGQAILEAIGDKASITRFGAKYAPLDEALARTVVDFSGRPSANILLNFVRESIGPVATENLTHFFVSMAMAGKFTLHVDVLKGDNDHHKSEAAFKATALAFKEALSINDETGAIPSTKGAL